LTKANTTQTRTPVNKAVAVLLIFKGCSNAIARYPRPKMKTEIISMRVNIKKESQRFFPDFLNYCKY
jgi:hypothetical protein